MSNGPTHASELDRGGDVKSHAYQQDDPDKPEQLFIAETRITHFPEKPRVSVDLVRAREYLEIAYHVDDHEADKNGAGDRHDDLLPNHCSPEGDNGIVGGDAPRHRHPVEVGRRIRILDAFHLFHSASPDSQGMYHVPLVIKLSLQSSQFSSTRPP